jgi:hypothetical protein
MEEMEDRGNKEFKLREDFENISWLQKLMHVSYQSGQFPTNEVCLPLIRFLTCWI